eukprot:TRINITY_DN11464_c0_g1_i1.p1 TRINITY_DN11464_c0_g1~~TRINITY_DN11464_c0_g1_i1.p1  ORF type:complete len:946 (-),score=233.42 TRINITY_DN11464_c0_g1_i1:121-2589(-)
MLVLEPVPAGASCDCEPEWPSLCNTMFSAAACPPCEVVCAINEAVQVTKFLEQAAPGFFAVSEPLKTVILFREHQWVRVVSKAGHLNQSLAYIIDVAHSERVAVVDAICHSTNFTFSSPYSSPHDNDVVVGMCNPILVGGKLFATGNTELSLQSTMSLLEGFTPTSDSFPVVSAQNGEVISATELAFQVLFKGSFSPDLQYNLMNSTIKSKTGLTQIDPSIPNGYFIMSTGSLYDNDITDEYVVFYAPVPRTPWSLLVFSPLAHYDRGGSGNADAALLGGLLGSVLAVLLLFVCAAVVAVAGFAYAAKHLHNKVQDMEQQIGKVGINDNLLGTPAEVVIKKLIAVNKAPAKLTPEQHQDLSEIVSLIASNKLYKADFISKRQMGLIGVDEEIDQYLTTTLLRYNSEKDTTAGAIAGAIERERSGIAVPRRTPSDELVVQTDEGAEISLTAWDFDVFSVHTSDGVLCKVAMGLIDEYNLVEALSLDRDKLMAFVKQIQEGYFNNQYHNVWHAADVLQAFNVCLRALGANQFTDLEVFAGLFSCMIHDYHHPGVNNNYLIATFDELALRYNGVAVLENMHAADSFLLLFATDEYNFIRSWSNANVSLFHKLVTTLVLSTDMAKHVEWLGQFRAKAASDKKLDLTIKADRELALHICVKFADVSNSSRNWPLAHNWAQRVMEEFFKQGDREKKLNLPVSPFMDRNINRVAKCQVTFIEFVIRPFVDVVVQLVPPMRELLLHNVEANTQHWQLAAKASQTSLNSVTDELQNSPGGNTTVLNVNTMNVSISVLNVNEAPSLKPGTARNPGTARKLKVKAAKVGAADL